MEEWQYQAVQVEADPARQAEEYQRLGRAGWELVSVVPAIWSQTGPVAFAAWFKRLSPSNGRRGVTR